MSKAPATSEVIDTALAELGEDEAEQLGLFAPAETEAGRRLQELRPGLVRRRGRGRRTERTVAWLLSQHRDPRKILLEIAEASIEDLVALLGCTRFEALQEKRLAAIGVLPYVAQKQPLAVNVSGRQVVYLSIGDGVTEEGGDELTATATIIENVQFQEVSDGAAATVGQSRVGQQPATPQNASGLDDAGS